MTMQTINLGTTANDGTGDTLRTAGEKINANFEELYDAVADLGSGGGGGSGGSGALSVQDEIYKAWAQANITLTTGGSGTLWNQVIDKGGFVIFVLCGTVSGTTMRAGTSYTVPAGKKAVIVDMKFDSNTNNDPTYYKHRLQNISTSTSEAGPNPTMTGNTSADWVKVYGDLIIPSPINANLPVPGVVATAGQSVRAEIGGGPDANSRQTFGLYVVAIVDATTNLMEPVT